MTTLLIINALILPMTQERKAFRGYVRVDGGVIVEVGADAPPRVQTANRLSMLTVARFCPASSTRIPISTKFCCARCGKIWN